MGWFNHHKGHSWVNYICHTYHGDPDPCFFFMEVNGIRGIREWNPPVRFLGGFSGCLKDMGVSKNRGTPKWMVYNGTPYEQMDDLGVPPF